MQTVIESSATVIAGLLSGPAADPAATPATVETSGPESESDAEGLADPPPTLQQSKLPEKYHGLWLRPIGNEFHLAILSANKCRMP